MSEPQKRRRRGTTSREAMLAKRSKPPAVNPAPPGPVGGQYKPLTDQQIQQIYATSLRMLAELGMGDAPQTLTDQALKCGATINNMGRLCFSPAMVEDIIDGACKSFVLHGRDPQHSFEVGGDQVYFGLNTGYMLSRGGWRFGPTASFSYLDSSIDGYTESAAQGSSSAWNFIVEDQDFESMRFSVGGQADYVINTSFGVLVPGVRAAYVYEAEDAGENIVLRLANNPFAQSSLVSDEIIVTTADRDSNFVDISINLSGQFVMGFSGYLSYQFYSAYDDYSQDGYTVGLRWDKPF